MTKYRVLIRQTEYRNVYVEAEIGHEAGKKAIEGDWLDSEYMDSNNPEIVSVEVWG